MLYYLHNFWEWFQPLNVFRYNEFRGVAAGITAFLFSLILGEWLIRKLISLKIGQPIRTKEEVHKLAELHGDKSGTPTMGGILIIGAVLFSTLLWARWDNLFVWLGLFTMVSLGLVGFVDDYRKVTKKKSDGMSGRVKLACQLAIAAVVGAFLIFSPDEQTAQNASAIYIPFFKEAVMANIGFMAILFYGVVMVGSSNAVNLTDGLDGLAIGCTITVAGAFAVLTYLAGSEAAASYLRIPSNLLNAELSVLCCALAGAGLGFLWFNCHPARVFMGDTGSLAIGGTLGLVAICCKQELLLVIIGGVFVLEALSVILQVASFKLRGKRIFLMSPLHHHFELLGWKENTVIVRFWILSVMFALIGLATLRLR
ncbi:MAG: phospho-N-acetylmuramoyl-pentapeptide-transferase [Verrucomicrobiales bacterium]